MSRSKEQREREKKKDIMEKKEMKNKGGPSFALGKPK